VPKTARRPQSPAWKALHDALGTGTLPPPRTIGMKMQLVHRACAPGRWSGEVVFDQSSANTLGTIHGGLLGTILDIAMGYASVTLLKTGESQRTLEMKINFLRGIPPDTVLVEGEVLRRGRRTSYCEGSVRTADGALVARGSATFYVSSSNSTNDSISS
jgi:uncharacterized protein (TIGR00369 family)